MLVDDEDEALTEREMEISFSECDDNEKCTRLLGNPISSDARERYPDISGLLQIADATDFGFQSDLELNFMMKESDMSFGNWKRTTAYLKKLQSI